MLELSGVNGSYRGSQVLFDVQLEIASAEVVTLMGRNGMGKTSLVRSVLGMSPLSRDSGKVLVKGRDVTLWPSHRIAQLGIGLVPEGREVFTLLSVEENLVATARPRDGGWSLSRVYEMFPRLSERRRQRADRLSGGEQQMLAIGRALMLNPELLILDEATEGLAPIVREEIWTALRSLRNDAISILIIDKSVEELVEIADRHYVIEKGRMMQALTSEQVRADASLVERYLHL